MPPKPKNSYKSIPKFQRSRYLILFCRGPKKGVTCGYAIELCELTAHWKDCPLCGGKLIRAWHSTRKHYNLEEDYEPYHNGEPRVTLTI